jgi:hypothetical protein
VFNEKPPILQVATGEFAADQGMKKDFAAFE